jgi:hypothetical protein
MAESGLEIFFQIIKENEFERPFVEMPNVPLDLAVVIPVIDVTPIAEFIFLEEKVDLPIPSGRQGIVEILGGVDGAGARRPRPSRGSFPLPDDLSIEGGSGPNEITQDCPFPVAKASPATVAGGEGGTRGRPSRRISRSV